MITGIQITKAANDDLLNSFWLLDSENSRYERRFRHWHAGKFWLYSSAG